MTALLPTRWTFSLSMSLIHLQGDTEVHQVAREGEKNQDSEENETEVVKCPQAENPPRNSIFSSGTLCPFSIVPKILFSGLMLPVADRMQRHEHGTNVTYTEKRRTRCNGWSILILYHRLELGRYTGKGHNNKNTTRPSLKTHKSQIHL